jgi:SSS family solute:Na+ symporter
MILVFLALLLVVNRHRLGVSSFTDYATASRSFGTLGITFGVLATWYVGAAYTAWAGFAVGFGFIAYYVTPYALMTLVVLYLVADRTFIWGKKYGIETQAELLGVRYQSNALRAVIGLAGAAFSIPWLLMEWWTQGFILSYASGGTIPPIVGMMIGVVIVIVYVAAGGMRSVITANILQGLYMFVIGTGLMIWMIYRHFGGFGELFRTLAAQFPETLTYPGPGWSPPSAFWTSIVITSGLGGFMWPWVYNKLFAADSVRSIKQTVLLAPVLGTIFYAVLVILGMGLHTIPFARENPQEAFLWIHAETGPIVLGLFGVLVTAASIGTVSGILNAMSTAISNDIALVIKRDISQQRALNIARVSVVLIGIGSLAGAALHQGMLIFLALLTYQGMIMLFPVVMLGLYWRRANKEGALAGFLSGTAVSFALTIFEPAFLGAYGWTAGVYGFVVAVVVMVALGFMKPESGPVAALWEDLAEAKRGARRRVVRRAARVAGDQPA